MPDDVVSNALKSLIVEGDDEMPRSTAAAAWLAGVRGPGYSSAICRPLALPGVKRGVEDFVNAVQLQALPLERVTGEAVVARCAEHRELATGEA